MEMLKEIVALVSREPGRALALAGVLYALLLALVLWALVRQAGLARRQERLLRGMGEGNLEQMLLSQSETVQGFASRIQESDALGQANAAMLRQCLQKVGVVRYDAFPDVGGGQSFSVALVDADGNGIVLSGLYSRHDLRVYAKPVLGGSSPLALSGEERDAIARSRAGGPEAAGPDAAAPASAGRAGGSGRR
jgi:hypothetical protein